MVEKVTRAFCGDELHVWDDNGVLMLKTFEPHGDPVEMTEEAALELGSFLIEWARSVRADVPRVLDIPSRAGAGNAPIKGDER